jgi:hypothetical protein
MEIKTFICEGNPTIEKLNKWFDDNFVKGVPSDDEPNVVRMNKKDFGWYQEYADHVSKTFALLNGKESQMFGLEKDQPESESSNQNGFGDGRITFRGVKIEYEHSEQE